MRSNRISPCFFSSAKGLSLLELGIVMVFISLALVPVVKMIGGPTSADGNAAQITGTKNKEAILANTMVNKVLAGDYTGFKCRSNGSALPFNPDTDLPKSNQMVNFGRCRSQNGNSTLFYEWDVLNLTASNNSNSLPSQNQYFQATFNVLDTAGNKLITMPINFFHNSGAFTQPSIRTGVMLSMDISGSMAYYASGILPYYTGSNTSYGQDIYYSSPYMFYRYKKFPAASNWGTFPNNPNYQVTLDPWDDSQLDLTIGKQISGSNPAGKDPNSGTAYNEAFPFSNVNPGAPGYNTWGNGTLGVGHCSSANPANWNSNKNFGFAFILPYADTAITPPPAFYGNPWTTVNQLCRQKNSLNDWSNTINTYLSRIEAARTAALSLLINLESNQTVANSIELGFIPWDHYAHTQQMVPLEKAVAIPGVSNIHFKAMRERLLWINRADPANKNSGNPVVASGATSLYDGVDYARQKLLEKNYDRRIIVALTDGAPTYGAIQSAAGLKNYALNTFGNNAPKNRQITLFTVGLIAADNNLLNGMASNTPDGQNFAANDVADLKPIFDAISYQIQKLALLSTADRYGLSF